MSFVRRSFLLLLSVALFTATGQAVVVDWDTLTWTPGTLTNSYDVDPAKIGNDITVTVSGNTGQLQPELVAPNPQTPAITTNFQGGLGAAQNTRSTASGNGNVTISFGTTAIKSFTFTYGSGSGTVADSTYQHVGIHDITFTLVPELNPTWTAVGSCLAAFALILRHSAKFRK